MSSQSTDRLCYERQLIISGGDEAVFCKTSTVFLRNILFSCFKSLISSADYVDESPRRHRKIPRCYRFSRCNAQLSGFKDACEQLNRISFNLSMTNRRFTGSDGVGGGLTWQSGRQGGRRKREGGKGRKWKNKKTKKKVVGTPADCRTCAWAGAREARVEGRRGHARVALWPSLLGKHKSSLHRLNNGWSLHDIFMVQPTRTCSGQSGAAVRTCQRKSLRRSGLLLKMEPLLGRERLV